MFEMLTCNVAVLAIAGLYYAWKDRVGKMSLRRHAIRERVAYMLWVAAQRA